MSTTAVDAGWLDWLADEAGAKVEVDAQGSIVVSPASDAHVLAANQLQRQLLTAITGERLVLLEGHAGHLAVLAGPATSRTCASWNADRCPAPPPPSTSTRPHCSSSRSCQ